MKTTPHLQNRSNSQEKLTRSQSSRSSSTLLRQTAITLLTMVAAALFGLQAPAQVTLPFYDPFPTSYGDGTALGNGASATAWTVGNSPGAGGMTNRTSAALSYPGLASSSGLGVVMPVAGGSPRDRGVQINPGTFGAGNPTLYVSFLLNRSEERRV